MPRTHNAMPTASFGYWRGAGAEGPQAYGQGSGYGPHHQGLGLFAQGVGPPGQSTGWTPTVTYLIVFVLAEIVAFGILARVLKSGLLPKVKVPK